MPLIEADLLEAIDYHNGHRIRSQPSRLRPSGRVEQMYLHPSRFRGAPHGRIVSSEEIGQLVELLQLDSVELPDFLPFAVRNVMDYWMQASNVSVTIDNASTVYKAIKHYILANL